MPNLALLLLQIGAILLTAQILGWAFQKIHQPRVIGEMTAGILLGPSLLGWLAPGVAAALFPESSLGFINTLSQLGLLLFMFLVGLELDLQQIRGQGHAAVVVSHVSIIVPFLLGALLAWLIYPRLSTTGYPFVTFALFVGLAMSITAFPVLARILTERGLLHTKLGTLAIACAAVDDVTGWCLLAIVVALARSSANALPIWATLGGSLTYVGLMVFGGRRALKGLAANYLRRGSVTMGELAFVLLLVLASGWITETLGIHALFGAFLMGVIMPKNRGFVRELVAKLEGPVVVLLLPLFFAFSGLRTKIGLVNGVDMWFYCALIIGVAVIGKFGGSSIAARLSGLSWREAGSIGILMNTRGLIELVLLNIGLDIGVLSPTLFSMLVLMALVTTFMTAPVLEWVYFGRFLPAGGATSAAVDAPRPADTASRNLAPTHREE